MRRKEVSMIGNLTRDMMRDVMETSLKKPIQTGEFRKNPVEPAWRCPGDYIYELVPTEKFVMEYLKPKQAVTGRVVLQLHGGGYIGPMKNIYRRFAVKYSELGLGADVLTPDYRVAPRARANKTLCCCPPESSLKHLSASPMISIFSIISTAHAFSFLL